MNSQSISPVNILCRTGKAISCLAVLLMIGLVATPASAGVLTGDTVSIELVADNSYGIQNVLVGPGEDGNYFGNQFFDLDSGAGFDVFAVRSTQGFNSIDGPGGLPVQWILSDLNFSGGMSLVGINILQDFAGGVTVSNLTATSVTFSYPDVAIPQGTYFQAQFVTRQHAVPEPASFAMFGLGAVGLVAGAIRRRRQTKAIV